MSFAFNAHCDDFHIATRLYLKLDLGLQRETVLHFFDSIKREFPAMRKLRRREDGSLLLEEEETGDETRRWLRLDEATIRMGYHNPPQSEAAEQFAQAVLKMAPYHLTLGDLDYDHLEVVYGFDLEYRGNHDQLVAETLLADGPLAGLLTHPHILYTIDAQPFLGFAISESCDVQVYVEIKSRTSTYEVRTRQFEPQPLSVFLTVRRYWGFSEGGALPEVHHELTECAEEWATERVIPMVVNPLAHAIASRP
ncbi:MAG TPA: hypothetical protein VMV94_05310 [Phycisphaerae bacterium]|nr:hypothetical protein [Phycisphaerae bacterium]